MTAIWIIAVLAAWSMSCFGWFMWGYSSSRTEVVQVEAERDALLKLMEELAAAAAGDPAANPNIHGSDLAPAAEPPRSPRGFRASARTRRDGDQQ